MPFKTFYLKTVVALLFLFLSAYSFSQVPVQDTAKVKTDSSILLKDSAALPTDTLKRVIDSTAAKPVKLSSGYNSIIQRVLEHNQYLNASGTPVATDARQKPVAQGDFLFYLLLALVLFLACLRFFFERYFNNLFRVFFNTSLRQSQLTDQLLQAKQVSLFFNILFACTGGLYIYFLLAHFNWIRNDNSLLVAGICIVSVAVIYFLKYLVLKFTGWLTGYREATRTYLFIIFLINKILGILLIPFIMVIGFAAAFLRYPAVLISLLFVGLMFLLRFLRSYGLLRKDIKVSRFHFFLYITGVELIPLLLIYKLLMVLLSKNL